jgi:peptidoglycan/LPS O-acetylase OafA/YrhL
MSGGGWMVARCQSGRANSVCRSASILALPLVLRRRTDIVHTTSALSICPFPQNHRFMSNAPGNLAYVDLLRGIAVLMVILVHVSQEVQDLSGLAASFAHYGQMGVQLFFIASAYTLCSSFDRRRSEHANVRSFYVRRIFRIAPLYYFGILIYFFLFISLQYYRQGNLASVGPYTISNVLANAFFLHGLVPQANNNVVPGGWSIGTEMLFYLIFPALFEVSTSMFKKWGLFGLLALLALALVANVAIQLALHGTWLSIKNNNFAYFSIANQLPVFISGIAVYFHINTKTPGDRLLTMLASGAGFLLFTAAAMVLWRLGIDFLFTVVPLAAGVAFAFLLKFLSVADLDMKLVRRIGEISYSMYIYHFLFAWYLVPALIRIFFGKIGGDLVLAASFVLSVAMSFLCARLTERAIEARGIEIGANIVRSMG